MRALLVLIASTKLAAAQQDPLLLEPPLPPPPPPKPVKLAAPVCKQLTRLIGQDPAAVAAVMKKHELKPITLEHVEVPDSALRPDHEDWTIVTLTIGKRKLRGILANVAGCITPNNRHAVDARGDIYQFDGPAGVVDYPQKRCHTPAGWKSCVVDGTRRILWVVRNPKAKLAGQFGSALGFFPTPEP